MNPAKDVGQVGLAYVQQGSAGPDRVKSICIIQLFKKHMPDGAADSLAREVTQILAAVHGQHLISLLCKIQRGLSCTAAEIQDAAARDNLLQETAVMRSHVHVRCAGDKFRSVILIPFQGIVLIHGFIS